LRFSNRNNRAKRSCILDSEFRLLDSSSDSHLNQRTGQTILMITHDQEAAAYANRIGRMRDGRIAD